MSVQTNSSFRSSQALLRWFWHTWTSCSTYWNKCSVSDALRDRILKKSKHKIILFEVYRWKYQYADRNKIKSPKNLIIPLNLCIWCWTLKRKWSVFWMICPYCSNWAEMTGDGGLLSAPGSRSSRKKAVKSSVSTNTDQNTSLQMFFSATAIRDSRIRMSGWRLFYLTCNPFVYFQSCRGFYLFAFNFSLYPGPQALRAEFFS